MRNLAIGIAAVLLLGGPAWALDTVKLATGTTVACKVTDMTSTQVTVDVRGTSKVYPVNEITGIAYEGEPLPLRNARNELVLFKYSEALEQLGKVELPTTRPEVDQDAEYFKALCASRLALEGTGKVVEAGKLMIAFLKAHPNSYHALEGNEVVGDLLVANGSYAQAEPYYRKLAAAPWPDYQMRAGVHMAEALMAQAKWAEAAQAFDGVTAIDSKSDAGEELRGTALVGKARCLVEQGKTDEAARAAQAVIDKTDSLLSDVQGSAYATLGLALRKANRNKEAIMAFLHVDLLYNTQPDAHAEALGNLVELWRAAEEPDRANQCLAMLKDSYPNSAWAKKLGN